MSVSIEIQVNHEGGNIKINYGGELRVWDYSTEDQCHDLQLSEIHKECQRSVRILRGDDAIL